MMNTTTMTGNNLSLNQGFFTQRSKLDWAFAALVVFGGLYVFQRYLGAMDVYEKGILLAAIPFAVWLGWFWRPLQVLMATVTAFSLLGIWSYQAPAELGGASLARAESVFWLKYFLSSQSAILWMSVLFFMSTIFYWIGVVATKQSAAMELIGSRLAWVAVAMALIGTMVRWYESYLLGADIGHIPVSNLYEVFVLFSWLTAVMYLYFEAQYKTRALGAFVMLVVSAAEDSRTR